MILIYKKTNSLKAIVVNITAVMVKDGELVFQTKRNNQQEFKLNEIAWFHISSNDFIPKGIDKNV